MYGRALELLLTNGELSLIRLCLFPQRLWLRPRPRLRSRRRRLIRPLLRYMRDGIVLELVSLRLGVRLLRRGEDEDVIVNRRLLR